MMYIMFLLTVAIAEISFLFFLRRRALRTKVRWADATRALKEAQCVQQEAKEKIEAATQLALNTNLPLYDSTIN